MIRRAVDWLWDPNDYLMLLVVAWLVWRGLRRLRARQKEQRDAIAAEQGGVNG